MSASGPKLTLIGDRAMSAIDPKRTSNATRPAAKPQGTLRSPQRCSNMAEPLPILIESSLQIAWDFLEGSGEIADPQHTAEFLIWNIRSQILKGERRPL